MTYSAPMKAGTDRREGRAARSEQRLSAAPFIADALLGLGYDSSTIWARSNYKASVLGLVEVCRQAGRQEGGRVRALEIGGGRSPLLTASEASAAGVAYTVNDILQRELDLGPPEFAKALFDIGGELDPSREGQYDLIFSKWVMEHVRDAPRAWENMARLLAPGGIALAYHPTLFAPGFVLNWLLPEWISANLLRLFFSYRNDNENPKFPAFYNLCRADQSLVEPALKRAGFRDVACVPFWGDIGYFRKVPGAREAAASFANFAESRDLRLVADFAYTIARK